MLRHLTVNKKKKRKAQAVMIEIKKTVYAPRGQAKTNHYSTCLLCRLVPHSNLFLFVIAQLSLTLLCLRKTDREREKRGETRLHRKANQLFRKENARTKIRKKKKEGPNQSAQNGLLRNGKETCKSSGVPCVPFDCWPVELSRCKPTNS